MSFTIHIENNGSIRTSENFYINQRNKHVDIKLHFIRDCFSSKKVIFEHVSSEHQLYDPLTETLGRVKINRFTKMMGVIPLYS